MTMGKSFNKSILFVLGIVLVVSAFSGCTDTPENDVLTTTDDNSGIKTAGGYTLNDLFDMAKNDPNKLLGMDINDVQIKGLGEAPGGSGVIENSEYNLKWNNPVPGIEKYTEEYGYNGKIKVVRIIKDTGNWFSIYDTRDNDDLVDDKISRILFKLNDGKKTKIIAE